MSIRTRILCACLSLTAVTLVFGLVTHGAQDKLGATAGQIYDEAFMSMSYLRSAQNTVANISRDDATGTMDAGEIGDRLDNAIGDIAVSYDRALSIEAKQLSHTISTQLEAMAEDFRTKQKLPDRAGLAALEAEFETAVEINAGDGFRARRAVSEEVRRLSIQTWATMALSIAIALAITAFLSNAIVPAVKHAVSIASAIAAGRLDNQIVAVGQGETSVLLRALAAMQRSISEKIARIEDLMAQQATTHASQMASQLARFETALDNMAQGLCMFDDEGCVLVHNRRFAELFAAVPSGTRGVDALPVDLLPATAPGEPWAMSRSFTRTLPDERIITVTERAMDGGGWVATYEDITERQQIEAQMTFMARHDALTKLPNRVLYGEQMEHRLAQVRRGGSLAVLCLDLDHFKSINDTLGHSVGDGLLQAVAKRLLAETRETDTVVRPGGDEFAIIQAAAGQPSEAKVLAERLVRTLNETFSVGDHQIAIGVSIGIATTMDGLTNADTLLKSAELALYRAKADGRNTYRFFEAEMDAKMQQRRLIEIDLRRAVIERQFENFYQPLIEVDTREISGFEALVRWRHPTLGMISPAEFIPVAEETGLIARIGTLVLQQACRDALTWPDNIKVAVNLSPVQFRNRHLAAEIASALEQSGLPASRLELEITESILMQDSEVILTMLREIRALGVHISMDDFGTGYSSLSYLRRFPFDKIKIDQSFIRSLEESGDCIAIVRAVLGLGRSLGMRVIAEGVETEKQLSILHDEGCEQVQGYLFSKPQPIGTVHTMLPSPAPIPAEVA